MAEIVQLNIENSIRELEQLERVGLFTAPEIRKVIKRRKGYEYRLARQKKVKEDYLKYIQYELGVLSLVRKRREHIGYKFKKDEIDHAIGKRINSLFKAVIKRYPQDTKLWLSHRDFLKRMNWYQNMSGMLTRMLQFHSKSPALWIVVAKWELEENNSPESARQICQRAIRFHPDSQLLWREYFRMELMYAYQLRKRREILNVREVDKDKTEVPDEVLNGNIAEIVYKQATSTLTDLDFALSFLPICADFDFTQEHENQIYSDVQERYPAREETWNVIARRRLGQVARADVIAAEEGLTKKQTVKRIVEDAFAIYDEAVEKIPTEKMWSFYIQSVLDRMEKSKSEKKMKKLLAQVLLLMKKAVDLSLLSSELCSEWVRLLNTCGQAEEAHRAALRSTELHPASILLWQLCLALMARQQDDNFLEYFWKGVKHVTESESYPLWQLAVEWGSLNDFTQLQDILEKGIVQSPKISVPLKVTYLEQVALRNGPKAARELYNRIKNVRPLSPEFYETMIFIENSELEPSVKSMRKCYEDAVLEFGNLSVEIWMNYIRLELQHSKGTPEAVGKLYWRAVKSLSPVESDEFVRQYTLLSTGHDPVNC